MTPPAAIDALDTGGLICGFWINPTSPSQPLRNVRELDAAQSGRAFWLHFNLVDARARAWLADWKTIPEEARAIFLDAEAPARWSSVGEGVVGSLGDLHYDFDGDPESIGDLRVYLDSRCVLTGRTHPLKSVDRVRTEVAGGIDVGTPTDLFILLLQDTSEGCRVTTDRLADAIDHAEDEVLKGVFDTVASHLGPARRILARLRRHTQGQRQALLRMASRPPTWFDEADVAHLRQAVEQFDTVAQDIELVQERARLVQEEIASRVGEATNRNLYLLSIVTAVFLPLSLITGLFGMNVGGLLWTDTPAGFWRVLLVMLAVAVTSMVLLRWKKFF